MRIVLPVIAVGIIALVFSWNSFQNPNIEPVSADEGTESQSIGKNELLNPRFESMDQKNQPYMITAERALQGGSEEDLILLDKPLADIALENGRWLAAQSTQAAFRQDSQRLLMKGDVQLFHDDGYTLRTEELDVAVQNSLARTDAAVQISGPAGTIDALGMEFNSAQDHLTFKGPAKLVLFNAGDSMKLGSITP